MCRRTTHHRTTYPRGHPRLRPCRYWSISDLHGILSVVAIPHPMGSLEAFRGGRPRLSRQTSPDSWQNPAPQPTSASNRPLYSLEWTSCICYASGSMSPTAPLRPRSRTHKPFISTPPKHKTSLPPAALCYCKPSTSPPRQRAWSVAITHGPARMSTFARKKACLRLCLERPRLPVGPKYGSQSITTAPSRSACTPDKLWVP